MKVLSQSNSQISYQPQFKGVNFVQISKAAFPSEDLQLVQKAFKAKLREAAGERPPSKTRMVLSLLTKMVGIKGKPPKRLVFFSEGPLFPGIMADFAKMKQKGKIQPNCGIEWVGLHSGIPIKDTSTLNKHSFYVLTGEHAVSGFNGVLADVRGMAKRATKESREKIKAGKTDTSFQNWFFLRDLTMNHKMTQELMKVTEDAPVQSFTVSSLEQLPEIYKQFAP